MNMKMNIKVDYKPLWKLMIDKNISRSELADVTKVSPSTFTKMRKNEFVSLEVLGRIAVALDCKLDDLVSISNEVKLDTKNGDNNNANK